SMALQAYQEAAVRSGLTPLPIGILNSERSRHVMGLYRRSELVAGIGAVLGSMRETLPSDTTRARFDRLFRPRGAWIADVHDAALAAARRRAAGIDWSAARRSLAGAGWIPAADSAPDGEAVPRALYDLAVLADRDSGAFAAARAALITSDSASAAAALLLLAGYGEGRRWYVDVMDFFLRQPWIPDEGRGTSLSDEVRDYWQQVGRRVPPDAVIPEILTRFFGYPQAVPRYGVPDRLFERLVRAENPDARAWLGRNGNAALLQALRLLPAGDSSLILLQHGAEAIRLTSVPRQARESLNGFLEPLDAIAIDPGYSPLLALGAIVHEWQHLLFRRRQLDAYVAGLPAGNPTVLELPWAEPYLAEGFAEWSAEQILERAARRWPLLAVGELEKRAGLAQTGVGDQHALGYALVRALVAVVPGREAITDLLIRHAEQPSAIARLRAARRAWGRYREAPGRAISVPAQRILVPEVTFTVEDGFPDVIASRILIPPSSRSPR
ncbi:MAG TPA: hypothetical protein VF252_05145, partial [Gemmatimonadales bacterium]